ncbi:MAG: hypothetical protein KAT91_02185 [Candidatus Aenigmarchaeota archaeon]|nr:hypothetical protein [Candidatus Aenigmarchaeota archaeon]
MLKKIDFVKDENIYSFVAGAMFMAAGVLIPNSIVFANSEAGLYGLLCLIVSLLFITKLNK